jgi:hypothetical protein
MISKISDLQNFDLPTGKLISTRAQGYSNCKVNFSSHFVLKYFFVNNLMTTRYQIYDDN